MCINDRVLSAYVDGELGEIQRSGIKEHLEICTACRKRVQVLNTVSNQIKIAGIDADQFVKETVWTRLVHSTSTNKELDFWHRGFILPPSLMVSISFMFLALIGVGLFWIIPDRNSTEYTINKSGSAFGSEDFPVEVPIDNIEKILAWFDIHDEALEVIIHLPDASFFVIQGEPRFLRKDDYIAGR